MARKNSVYWIVAFLFLSCFTGAAHAAALDTFVIPSGGEVYIDGQQQQVQIARGSLKSNVLIELSRDGGTTFATLGTIAAPLSTNTKLFVLNYTVSGPATGTAIIRASGVVGKGKETILSPAFAIAMTDPTSTVPAGSVGTTGLADGSVTTSKLADGAVTTPKLAEQSVTADKLNSGAASSGFILAADGLGGAQYVSLGVAIPNNSIVDASVSPTAAIAYSKLNLTGSIQASDIKPGSIIDSLISPTAGIQYSKLALTNSIQPSDIKPGAIVDSLIAANAGIEYSKLNLFNSIAATDIKTNSILNAQISTNAAIAYSKLNLTGNILGSDIQPGAISDANISATAAIEYRKLNLAGSILGSDLQNGSISNAQIAANAGIQYSKLNLSNSIGAGDIKAASIVDSLVSANAGIQYFKLNLANSILGSDIQFGQITDANISATAAIEYSKLNLFGSVQGSDIAAGTITLDKLSAAGATAGQALVFNGTSITFGNSGLSLPTAQTVTTTSSAFAVTNLADATVGSFTINDNIAVSPALQGITNGSGAGVMGMSAFGDGVFGQSSSGNAVHGKKLALDSGSAGLFENTNATNMFDTLSATTNSAGLALHALNGGSGPAATLEVSSTTTAANVVNVNNPGVGNGINVNVTNVSNTANAINISHSGTGNGVFATSAGGLGVWGVSNSIDASGVQGDNAVGGAGVTGRAATGNTGGVVGNNAGPGPGGFFYSVASGGYGVFTFGGPFNTNSIAAHFENIYAANTANTVEVVTNAATPALDISSTAASSGIGIHVAMPAGTGSAAISVTNGALSFSSTAAAASPTSLEHAYLIVTTAGPLTLPVAAPLNDGTTVWVVNNAGAGISVTNTTIGSVTVVAGKAQQFLFIKAVSTVNWIPVQP